MAISMSKRKSKPSKKTKAKDDHDEFFHYNKTVDLFKSLCRIPTAILLLIFVLLWSSSTTIISEKMIHVCVSSRKLNNLYCLSAGTKPTFEIPIQIINNATNTTSSDIFNEDLKEIVEDRVVDDKQFKLEARVPLNNTNEIVDIVRDVSNPVVRSKFVKDSEEEIAVAKKAIEEQLELHRSWTSDFNRDRGTCDGRGIFVYNLPSKFNKDLLGHCHDLVPWFDFCKYLENGALGEPMTKLGKGWYETHQYSLEPMFHSRVLKHPCRVYNENEAKLFYVPFYGGFDILRWHFKNVSNEVKDSLGLELVNWLEGQKFWGRKLGKDHVFVLGKISWDFRRYSGSSWGTRFLELNQMQNPIKLLIERQPWHENDIGIPHPTYFHPHADDDIFAWQWKIVRSYRKNLIAFAGAARPKAPDNIRSMLINQCNSVNNTKCLHLDCKSGGCGPESVIELFMESEFCLQPPGDSPTRKSVFDSLISGCIPVFFDPFTAYYQYPWHLPEDHGKYSVFIDKEEMRKMKVNMVERLMNVSTKERDDMRSYLVYELLPGLVYGDSNSELEKFQDAFSITMNNLLDRVDNL